MANIHVNKGKDKEGKAYIANINYLEVVSTSKLINTAQADRDKLVFMKIKDEMSAFFAETSFTALTQIYKANSPWKRLLWIILVIGMFAWLGVQCYWLLNKYYSYPMEIKMDLKAATALEFPSVTICNLNPIREETLNQMAFMPLMIFMRPEIQDVLFRETLENWSFNGDCKPGEFKCMNGRCLNKCQTCDGKEDCKDGGDETDCEAYKCPVYMWKCTSLPKCIGIHLRCNGIAGDCRNTSDEDEADCDSNTCPENFFRCGSGLCISDTYVCDNTTDCVSAEDESNCPASTTIENGTDGRKGKQNQDGAQSLPPAKQASQMKDTSTLKVTTADIFRRKREAGTRFMLDETVDTTKYSKDEHPLYNNADNSRLSSTNDKQSSVRKHLSALWNDMKESMQEEQFLNDLHVSYLAHLKSEVFQRSVQKEAEDNTDAHHRVKRQGRPPPEYPGANSSLDVDWNAVLKDAIFNKWDMLNNSDMSSRFYEERDDEYEATMTYAFISAQLDPDFVEQSGHQKENFIAACEFGGYQCSPENFTYFHSHKYGNCYTFNSHLSSKSKLETRFPGPEYGLRLELFLDQTNYVANLATEAGARILIHKKGSVPFPEDEGISIMPGRSTSVGIRQITYSRLPPPHGVCGNTGQTKDYYGANLGTKYTKLACLKSCYQDQCMKACNCVLPMFYVLDITKVCNMLDKKVGNCVMDLHNNQTENLEVCDKICPQPCEETRYDMSISTAKWPSVKYKDFLQLQLCQTNSVYRKVKDSEDEFTKVQIYFQDLIYQHVEQQKAYESMSLISDLGGQLGLWLGLSAITLGELCSFLFGIGRSLPLKCWVNKTRPSHPNKTSVMPIEPATLEEMYEDMCPETAKYMPPDSATTETSDPARKKPL